VFTATSIRLCDIDTEGFGFAFVALLLWIGRLPGEKMSVLVDPDTKSVKERYIRVAAIESVIIAGS